MASTKYTYAILTDFPYQKVDTDRLIEEIGDSSITIALDFIGTGSGDCDIWFKAALSESEETTLDGIVAAHSGEPLPTVEEKHDVSGRLHTVASPRPFGKTSCFVGASDLTSDVEDVGGGLPFMYHHKVGDPFETVFVFDSDTTAYMDYVYMDMNVVENETWLNSGLAEWDGCQMDHICVEIVPYPVDFESQEGTDYLMLASGIIIPAPAPGYGNVMIDSTAVLEPYGGLTEAPTKEGSDGLMYPQTAFWNADWNSTTNKFENLTPAPSGDGNYNLFGSEYYLARFVTKMTLLDGGRIVLETTDATRIGHGMRFRARLCTHIDDDIPDHEWKICVVMKFHRDFTC